MYGNGSVLFMGFDPSLCSILDSMRGYAHRTLRNGFQLYQHASAAYLRFSSSPLSLNSQFGELLERYPLSFAGRILGGGKSSAPDSLDGAEDSEKEIRSPIESIFSRMVCRFISDLGDSDYNHLLSNFSDSSPVAGLAFAKFFKGRPRHSSGGFRMPPEAGSLVRHYYLSRFRLYGSLTNLSGVSGPRSAHADFRHLHALPQFLFIFDVGRSNSPFMREAAYIRVPFLTLLDSDMDGALSNYPLFSNNDRSAIARFWHGFFTLLTCSLFRLDLGTLYPLKPQRHLLHAHRCLDIFRYELPLTPIDPRHFSIPEPAAPRLRLKRFITMFLGAFRPSMPQPFPDYSRSSLLGSVLFALRSRVYPPSYRPHWRRLFPIPFLKTFLRVDSRLSFALSSALSYPYFSNYELQSLPGPFPLTFYMESCSKGLEDWLKHGRFFAPRREPERTEHRVRHILNFAQAETRVNPFRISSLFPKLSPELRRLPPGKTLNYG